MYDSVGSLKTGNMKEWNWLLFKSFHYGLNNEYSGSQFTRPYASGLNVYFLINATTPKEGEGIQEIYFKKISR